MQDSYSYQTTSLQAPRSAASGSCGYLHKTGLSAVTTGQLLFKRQEVPRLMAAAAAQARFMQDSYSHQATSLQAPRSSAFGSYSRLHKTGPWASQSLRLTGPCRQWSYSWLSIPGIVKAWLWRGNGVTAVPPWLMRCCVTITVAVILVCVL